MYVKVSVEWKYEGRMKEGMKYMQEWMNESKDLNQKASIQMGIS